MVVNPHTVVRDIAEAGLMRMVRTVAVVTPSIALIQVLANSHEYRRPAVAIAVWLAVLGAAAWLVPRMRTGGLSAGETAAAIAFAITAVAVVGLTHQAHPLPGSVDLAILGTIGLLVLVVMSRPAPVWILAALIVFAVHSALLIRAEGLNRLSLSELEAAGYITAAILIVFAALRPTLAVHASMAARRSALSSRSSAESAAAAAIARERQSRLAVLEKEALPLLRAIADGTLDPAAADVRDRCARHAAVLRHSLTGHPPGAGARRAELAAGLEPTLRAARERGVLVDVQLIGDPGTPPPRLARTVQATVEAVLDALPPQQATLTILACGDDLNSSDTSGDDTNGLDTSGDDPKGSDVELYLTFDAPPRSIPDLTRFAQGSDLPAAARWHATVNAAEPGGGYLEASWRNDGAR